MALALALAGPVIACGIDGIPSMTMNGRLVTINYAQATKANFAHWASFSLGTAKSGTDLRFSENTRELHKSLTARAFATPFQWTFGDGSTARGLTVAHRYAKPGWYKVNVNYYYTPRKSWIPFDSAQLQIPGVAAPAREGSLIGAPAWVGGTVILGLAALSLAAVSRRRRRTGQPVPSDRARTIKRARRRSL
ncbi:MAG TPA: PKD domain-containing protein [Chloroflexota bacterium]|nr:PKD domain-containing protein [Chloroflexota bacterium]